MPAPHIRIHLHHDHPLSFDLARRLDGHYQVTAATGWAFLWRRFIVATPSIRKGQRPLIRHHTNREFSPLNFPIARVERRSIRGVG